MRLTDTFYYLHGPNDTEPPTVLMEESDPEVHKIPFQRGAYFVATHNWMQCRPILQDGGRSLRATTLEALLRKAKREGFYGVMDDEYPYPISLLDNPVYYASAIEHHRITRVSGKTRVDDYEWGVNTPKEARGGLFRTFAEAQALSLRLADERIKDYEKGIEKTKARREMLAAQTEDTLEEDPYR